MTPSPPASDTNEPRKHGEASANEPLATPKHGHPPRRIPLPSPEWVRDQFTYDLVRGSIVRLKDGRAGRVVVCSRAGQRPYERRVFDVRLPEGRTTLYATSISFALAYGRWPDPDLVVDHIDGNPLNDDPANLSEISHTANVRKGDVCRKAHVAARYRALTSDWSSAERHAEFMSRPRGVQADEAARLWDRQLQAHVRDGVLISRCQ